MAGKFEVYEDAVGKFRFRLRASNGQVVASGRGYASKAAAKRGCRAVLKAAAGAPIESVPVGSSLSALSGRTGDADSSGGPASGRDLPEDQPHASVEDGMRSERDEPSGPPRRNLGFVGIMSAEADLATRSAEILRDAAGRSA